MSALTAMALGVLLIGTIAAVMWAVLRSKNSDHSSVVLGTFGASRTATSALAHSRLFHRENQRSKTEEIVAAVVGRDEGLKSRRVRTPGDVSGYGLRKSIVMQREAYPEGCLVTITIEGRAGSGRSSVACAIEALLVAHGVVVENTDGDAMGMIQASANLKRIGPDLTVVIRSERVR